jgi:hypothetical protein
MWVGILRLNFSIPGARSLKDRRMVVNSLKGRLAHRFRVVCAEVGEMESWTRASLGIASCSNDREFLEEMIESIVRYSRNDPDTLLGGVHRDIFRFEEGQEGFRTGESLT